MEQKLVVRSAIQIPCIFGTCKFNIEGPVSPPHGASSGCGRSRRPSHIEGNCYRVGHAAVNAWQGWSLQFGIGRGLTATHRKKRVLRNVTQAFDFYNQRDNHNCMLIMETTVLLTYKYHTFSNVSRSSILFCASIFTPHSSRPALNDIPHIFY
jgi:hypothetical protein